MTTLSRFLAPVSGSIKGYLNFEELYRSFLTSLGLGSAVALILFLSRTILGRFAGILPDPATASLVTMLLGLILDLLRRLAQGDGFAPSPIPAPAPPPLPTPVPILPAT